MKMQRLKNNAICITMLFLISGICACGRTEDDIEAEQDEQREHAMETGQELLDNPAVESETKSENALTAETFDLEDAKAFMLSMDNDMQKLVERLDEQGMDFIEEKEITDCIGKYYDENLTDYAMFLYRIRPDGEVYIHDRRYGTANFVIDTDTEMTMITQGDHFCEIGVTFEHHWERSWDKEVVPVRLEWKEESFFITSISQWYNDFRYQYMPDELFTPKSFSEEEAQDAIERFGTDESGNPVPLSITADENGFLLAGSNGDLLTETDINGLSKYEMYMAVQEIYARHGKKFSDAILSQYFNRQEWYMPYEKIFSQETLSAIEEANIQLLIQEGKLEEEARIDYGSLYPVGDAEDAMLTEEEAVRMIVNAFTMADEVICAKEENYIGTEDVFRIYSLGEYSNEESLRDYLSAWFSEEAIDYLITIYTMCKGLSRNEEGSYQYITEGTSFGEWQEIDLLERAEIMQTDVDMCRVKVPFVVEHMAWWGLPNGRSSGEFLLCKKDDGWTISGITQTYYDELYQEYMRR